MCLSAIDYVLTPSRFLLYRLYVGCASPLFRGTLDHRFQLFCPTLHKNTTKLLRRALVHKTHLTCVFHVPRPCPSLSRSSPPHSCSLSLSLARSCRFCSTKSAEIVPMFSQTKASSSFAAAGLLPSKSDRFSGLRLEKNSTDYGVKPRSAGLCWRQK